MSPEKQRIAIAESMGYERLVLDYESLTDEPGLKQGEDGVWRTPSANKWHAQIEAQDVHCVGDYFVRVADGKIFADFDGPDTGVNGRGQFDFLNDLNAMHEAEKVFTTAKSREQYITLLGQSSLGHTAFSNAAQRAEAFLKTIGKWEEAK